MDAFVDSWGSHKSIYLHPVPTMTKLGCDGKPVDIGGRRFKHALVGDDGDWMLPASAVRLGKTSWLWSTKASRKMWLLG